MQIPAFFNLLGQRGASMRSEKRQEIIYRIADKPYLEIVETSVLKIPEQVEDIDRDFFICRNTKDRQFEIHSLGNREKDTLCVILPIQELDGRVVEMVRRGNVKTRGMKIFNEMEQQNRGKREEIRNNFRNNINAVARETRPLFAKYAWEN